MWRDRGFTLVELLVVIAIIGILAGIIFVSAGSTRRDARDKRRKADVEQIAGLLQIKLAQDKSLTSGSIPCNSPQFSDQAGFLNCLVQGGYAAQIPLDPINDNVNRYQYQSLAAIGSCTTQTYAVIANLEGTSGNTAICGTPPNQYVVVGN